MSSTFPPGSRCARRRRELGLSPAARRPSGRKHWLPGCGPGCATARSRCRRRPTLSPWRCGVRSDSATSVTRETHLASWIFTCTGNRLALRGDQPGPQCEPHPWCRRRGRGGGQVTRTPTVVGFPGCPPVRGCIRGIDHHRVWFRGHRSDTRNCASGWRSCRRRAKSCAGGNCLK